MLFQLQLIRTTTLIVSSVSGHAHHSTCLRNELEIWPDDSKAAELLLEVVRKVAYFSCLYSHHLTQQRNRGGTKTIGMFMYVYNNIIMMPEYNNLCQKFNLLR